MSTREYPSHPLVAVGAVIIKDGKILLVKRRYEPKANYWTLPGGLVKLGEGVRQALIREVREECGIEIEPKRIIDVIDFIEKDENERFRFHYVIVDFEAIYRNGAVKPASDVQSTRWFFITELNKVKLPIITKNFLKEYFEI
ncbi:MAG: NUDIX hydrolase [bacterium]